jgi:hypothetical protein
MSDHDRESKSASQFAAQAAQRQGNLVSEIFAFLRHTRKWWLAPAIVLLAIAGLLVVLGGTAVAPFIYTLF